MEAKIAVETRFDESMIVQEIHGASNGESLVKSVIRLKEDGTRKALSELGYMEPAEAKALRARVAELEALAVVVPELTNEDLNSYSMDCDERDAVEFGYNLAASRARAIPADRVLGDGDVKVSKADRRELTLLRQNWKLWESPKSSHDARVDSDFALREFYESTQADEKAERV